MKKPTFPSVMVICDNIFKLPATPILEISMVRREIRNYPFICDKVTVAKAHSKTTNPIPSGGSAFSLRSLKVIRMCNGVK